MLRLIIVVALGLFVVACGSSEGAEPEPAPSPTPDFAYEFRQEMKAILWELGSDSTLAGLTTPVESFCFQFSGAPDATVVEILGDYYVAADSAMYALTPREVSRIRIEECLRAYD